MHHTEKIIPLAFFAAAVFLLGFVVTHAATPTEGDPKILTPQDRQNISGCKEDPYPTLRKAYRKGDADGINKLNRDFACRLSNFIQAYPQICITSAYRSVERQSELYRAAIAKYGSAEAARKWVAPPGNSMHNKGLAADLCNIPQAARNAVVRYGLVFRMGHEPWHIEPSGAVKGGQPEGDPSGMPSGAPTSGLTNQLRNAFNPEAQQQQQMCTLPDGYTVPCASIANRGATPTAAPAGAPAGAAPSGAPSGGATAQPALNGQNTAALPANTCTPQTYCSNSSIYYRDNSCVDQLRETCPNGCSGTKCLSSVSSILTDALSKSKTATGTPEQGEEKKATTTAFDQISIIAEPGETGTSSAPIEPFDVVVGGDDTVTLHGEGGPTMRSLEPGAQTSLPPSSQQTFVSGDLKYSPTSEPQVSSTFRATLLRVRDTLVNILAYLRPFGRPTPFGEHIDEFVE